MPTQFPLSVQVLQQQAASLSAQMQGVQQQLQNIVAQIQLLQNEITALSAQQTDFVGAIGVLNPGQ